MLRREVDETLANYMSYELPVPTMTSCAKNGSDPYGLAAKHSYSERDLVWTAVESNKRLLTGKDSDAAEQVAFGVCPGSDVVAYRYGDQGHNLKLAGGRCP